MSNQLLFIGKDVNYAASKTNSSADSASHPSDLASGAVGLYDLNNDLIKSTDSPTVADTPELYLARGVANDEPLVSPVINGRDVIGWNGYSYYSGQVQRTFIGYTGSGSLDINPVNDKEYGIILTHISAREYKKPYQLASTKSAESNSNAFDIAQGLVVDGNNKFFTANNQFQVENQHNVYYEVISDVSSSSLKESGGSNITASVKHGSKKITLSGSSSGGSNLSPGDTLRIGDVSNRAYPVYVVDTVNGTDVTLTREYVGIDNSGVALGYISGKPTGEEAGIEIYGADTGEGFDISTYGGFEGTPITYSQRPIFPQGTEKQIAKKEKRLQAKWGQYNLRDIPVDFPTYVESGVDYDTYQVKIETEHLNKMSFVSDPSSPLTIQIAVPIVASTFKSDFENPINNWFNSVNFGSVNL